ncbi:glycine cleavage system transcriptional repressor [Aurantivibrio infirmus]
MPSNLVITIISDDKPGIVESLANTIKSHHGNWLDSRMLSLAGKFAGILQASVEEEHLEALSASLLKLSSSGLKIIVERSDQGNLSLDDQRLGFSIVGNDRPGIIHDVTQALATRKINLEELNSRCTSMPHVGTPLFEATGIVRLPEHTDLLELENQLDQISEMLAIDIQLEEDQN